MRSLFQQPPTTPHDAVVGERDEPTAEYKTWGLHQSDMREEEAAENAMNAATMNPNHANAAPTPNMTPPSSSSSSSSIDPPSSATAANVRVSDRYLSFDQQQHHHHHPSQYSEQPPPKSLRHIMDWVVGQILERRRRWKQQHRQHDAADDGVNAPNPILRHFGNPDMLRFDNDDYQLYREPPRNGGGGIGIRDRIQQQLAVAGGGRGGGNNLEPPQRYVGLED